MGIGIVPDEEGCKVIVSHTRIGSDDLACVVGEVDDSYPSALPPHTKLPPHEIHMGTIEGAELGYTQTRGVDALEYSPIPHALYRVARYRIPEPYDLLGSEECYLTLFLLYEIDHDGIETLNTLFAGILKKRPECDHVGIACFHRASALVERQAKFIAVLDPYILESEGANS